MELEMASSAMAADADDEKLPWDPSKGIEHAARLVCCGCGDVPPPDTTRAWSARSPPAPSVPPR